MKVLLVNPILHTAEKGIIPHYDSNDDCMIYTMARGFIELGHEVTLIASEDFKATKPEDPGFEVIYFKSRMPRVFKPHLLPRMNGFTLWLRQHHREYDIVITREVFSLASLSVARVCPEKSVIWNEMDVYQNAFRRWPAKVWYNIIAPLFMKRMRVVGASVSAVKFIRRFLPLVEDTPVDHGIDGGIFYPTERKRRQFVVVSQLIPRKRIDSIIRKFKDFLRLPGYGDYRLEIVGRGAELENLQSLTRMLGLESNVTFRGRLPHKELAAISRESVAMLIDTERDLNMVSIPESIASGTPVLTNSEPSRSAWINLEKTGIAKDGWGAEEMKEIADNNRTYVANCLRVRDTLVNTGCAAMLIRAYEKSV